MDLVPSVLTDQDVITSLPPRQREAHKGDFGHVLVVGGDYGMAGAVRLAAEAAARVGAGLVSVATRPEHAATVCAARPELMCHGVNQITDIMPLLAKATVVLIGPGLGKSGWARQLLAQVRQIPITLLLDADALNLLAEQPGQRPDWVLTPHPGEAGRLLQMPVSAIQQDRISAIQALKERYHGTVVLKGAGSLVLGERLWQCNAGNPGMATGGMGDVLSGVIAGLIAQGLTLEDAARIGIYIHARAGDQAAAKGQRGLLAQDVINELRSQVN